MGTGATAVSPKFVIHVSRVVVEATTECVKVESRPRAKTESLGMWDIIMKRMRGISRGLEQLPSKCSAQTDVERKG